MLPELYLCSTHTAYILPADQFGGYFCKVATVAHLVPGHKTRPVCDCEGWERMVVLEEKRPFMSFPPNMPQTYLRYNYVFDHSKETVKYKPTQPT